MLPCSRKKPTFGRTWLQGSSCNPLVLHGMELLIMGPDLVYANREGDVVNTFFVIFRANDTNATHLLEWQQLGGAEQVPCISELLWNIYHFYQLRF